jgi:hypothetical protein
VILIAVGIEVVTVTGLPEAFVVVSVELGISHPCQTRMLQRGPSFYSQVVATNVSMLIVESGGTVAR